MTQLIRALLFAGAAIDFFVGALAVLAPGLIGPLLDFPVNDPSLALIAGGEFLVSGSVYVIIASNPRRFQPFFFVVALDQFFAALLPAIEIGRGTVPATWKTVGPIPFNVALMAAFLWAARSTQFRERRR